MDREIELSTSVSLRVRYSEVDRMGLLYHVNYLEYFELARSEWIRRFWLPYKEIEDRGYALVVLEAHIRFIRPAYYDDGLTVTATISDWGRSRIKFNYNIHRAGEGELICTGSTSHCFINSKTGRVIRMPDGLKEKLDGIESADRI
ncbi:MAG TPA: acyl-CoA thioesterase [Bacteroidetes bacterium]|nr:acyl-CoA thioesterase [Bacteroidota bacterium]